MSARFGAKAESKSALGGALLGFVLLVILMITWAPFRLSWPDELELTWFATVSDLIINVFLFVPPGFLFSATLGGGGRAPGRRRRIFAATALAAVLFSATIEAGQFCLVDRYSSLLDVLTNGLGACLGAFIHLELARGFARRLPGHRALELPLMNLLYLLTILLWLNGLASLELPWAERRTWLVPLLAFMGVVILSQVWRFRFAAAFTRLQMVVAVTLWLVAATIPALLASPWIVLASVAAAPLLTWHLTGRRPGRPVGPEEDERRFELPTLRRAAAIYALYLSLLGLWPLTSLLVPPAGMELAFHLSGLSTDPTIPELFGVLEHLVAFAILGFIIAEASGRSRGDSSGDSRLAPTLLRVLLIAGAAALLFQLFRGLHQGLHTSIVEGTAALVAAVVGAVIYRRQLTVLRAWLARGDDRGVSALLDDLLLDDDADRSG